MSKQSNSNRLTRREFIKGAVVGAAGVALLGTKAFADATLQANKEKLYGLLVSDKAFKDFTVRLKFKCLTGDSGFYIRTTIEPPEKAHGLQIQVGPPDTGSGGIYESYGRAWLVKPTADEEKAFLKPDDWNDMTIAAHGGHVVVHVNGTKSAEIKDDPGPIEGHFALQMHSGRVMEVRFKDIAIQEGP